MYLRQGSNNSSTFTLSTGYSDFAELANITKFSDADKVAIFFKRKLAYMRDIKHSWNATDY